MMNLKNPFGRLGRPWPWVWQLAEVLLVRRANQQADL